ncbi:MAG: MAPEG family protein [Pseudomonadota bacterium]
MRADAIFAPVSVLALWTGLVVAITGFRRIRAVRARRVSARAFRLGESAEVPEDVAVANRNLMNLLEMPVLFYVVAIAFYVTHHVGRGPLTLAWIYAALRILHSCEHLTTNHILRRLALFATSNVVLLALWIRFVRAAL